MTKSANAVPSHETSLSSVIQRIATGPELSKDISQEEAHSAMRQILEKRADPVQAGVFLIALRMKRETDEENLGILDALREKTLTVTAAVDEVVDIGDPYDGYARSLPASPFLPALLAACGVPAVSHGVESIGPKYGVTHHQVLRAAGVPVDLTPEQAAARVADPAIGWSYVDQSAFCPSLYDLTGLRRLIVKRPVLTTIETLLGPIRGRRSTHLMTGYVHKPYARVYAMLARHSGFDTALLVRGVEGGVIPSLRQAGKLYFYHDRGEEQSLDLDPLALGIDQAQRAAPLPPELALPEGVENARLDTAAVAAAAAQAGAAALGGAAGPVRDSLIYAASICLWHLGRHDSLAAAAQQVRHVLDSGAARARLQS